MIKIARICNDQGVKISDFSGYPLLFPLVVEAFTAKQYANSVRCLYLWKMHSSFLGFTIADEPAIAYLSAHRKEYEPVQSAYIPPRIWNYLVQRVSQCVKEFNQHRSQIEEAYQWLVDAYEFNERYWSTSCTDYISPFFKPHKNHRKPRITCPGGLEGFLEDRGLLELFERWVGLSNGAKDKQKPASRFTSYLNLVRNACCLYILSFSLQRKSEASNLMTDCFHIEQDEKLGDVALLFGETTKTDPDSDARWVVPKHVGEAVEAAACIAQLRSGGLNDSTAEKSQAVLPLMMRELAPWSPETNTKYPLKPSTVNMNRWIEQYPQLFDMEGLIVTEADWRISLSLTPNLKNKPGIGVGQVWQLNAHQLRRTSIVNMFASNLVSTSSLQWLSKHRAQEMTLYYGRNYTSLRLNSSAQAEVVVEKYRSIYRQFSALAGDAVEYVRPHGKETISNPIIHLVKEQDEKALIGLIRKGLVSCRLTLLGACMKCGNCEYGGIESVTKCAGTDGSGICSDAIFFQRNKPKLIKLKAEHEIELETLDEDSPRGSALKQEVYGIGVYLSVVK